MNYINVTLILTLFLFTSGLRAQFYEVPTPTYKNLRCVDFPSANVGYIGGEDSVLLKTVDGGLTWSEVNHTGLSFNGHNHFN